jgi:hypothetical protein
MLNIVSEQVHGDFCDGLSRRSFLKIGGLAMGGLALPQILEAESRARQGHSHKAVIMIFLAGGPPHQDMYDLKMDAPLEIRGEFQPIQTQVPGIEICELLPRMAGMMDKLSVIRSIVGATNSHYAFRCMTGRHSVNQPPGGWPSFGSTLSKLQGPTSPSIPPFVGLQPKMGERRWADPGQPGFLGASHSAFKTMKDGRENLVLQGLSLERLRDRRNLLAGFDHFRREVDTSGIMEGMDAFSQQAYGILTSSKLARALDLEREDIRVRDRYGRGTAENVGDGAPKLLDQFLLARRLVEAGVRVVSLAFSRWDWHGGNFRRARQDLPLLDQGVTALVEDLHQRGLDKDVSVVVWGEFGRTPKINEDGGRDHWPQVSCALLAGGGMRHGQVIGATNRLGEYAKDRPVHFQEVLATLYHNMGIDPNRATVTDLAGRPHYLVDENRQPLPELV